MKQVHGQSHFRCDDCNTFHFPTEINKSLVPIEPQGKVTEFQCPKCQLSLEVGLIHQTTETCFCSNCRGFVLPSPALGDLISDLRARYQGPDDQPQPIDPNELDIFDDCPACLEKMESHPYYGPGNVVLDTCPHCQIAWLDHGELAKIVRAPGPRPGQKRVGNLESEKLRNEFYHQGEAAKAQMAARFMGL